MQVDPRQAAQAQVYVNTADGNELALEPGRQVVARVVAVGAEGAAKISLAGQVVDVMTDAAMRVGDEVRLSVSRADATGVRLAIVPPEGSTPSAPPNAPSPGTSAAGALVGELAKAGVQVTPQLARSVAALAQQLGGGSEAVRAVANLASRELALSPAAAGRVAAALEVAGSIGPALASLAGTSSEVAAALPAGTPSGSALRGLLAPSLSNSELAVARIVQAAQGAGSSSTSGLPSPPSSSAAVIQNYVASQVAASASLDDLAAGNSVLGAATATAGTSTGTGAGQGGAGAGAGAGTGAGTSSGTGLAPAALQAALRGQAAATLPAGDASEAATTAAPATRLTSVPTGPNATAADAPPPSEATRAAPQTARANATAAAATGAAAAAAPATTPGAARAIADLATLATRFAPAVAPGAGAIGVAADAAGRDLNAATAAQQAGPAGSAGAAALSVAGGSASGDPAPLVSAMQTFLASGGAEDDAAKLLRSLAGSEPALVQTALRALPESQSLQLAGRLLDLLGAATPGMHGARLHELRHGVHAALHDLGRALAHDAVGGSGGGELAVLRNALEHVAANDPRPTVAADAARLLAASDGQQVLSRTTTGADPGYVYFQVPLPDGRGAEVMVRRDPARRHVTFDEFNIAFLLDTEQLGTLMIQLDAHPAGIRADVKTDVPALEPFLRARTEALVEPLGRESRRPVTVTTGVFEEAPPTTLLEPQLGSLAPGVNEFYA